MDEMKARQTGIISCFEINTLANYYWVIQVQMFIILLSVDARYNIVIINIIIIFLTVWLCQKSYWDEDADDTNAIKIPLFIYSQ